MRSRPPADCNAFKNQISPLAKTNGHLMTRFVTAVVILVLSGECRRINKPMIKGADVIMLKKTAWG